ncbi:MAG TPA: fibronectin type III domain-containing protein [Solirubrobacteraceae bacterium]
MRRVAGSAVVSVLVTIGVLGLAPAAGAATTTQLLLSQGAAFSILGHSCGGIQEHAYATGFGSGGYPAGDVYMQTRCGGSGRGGGYKTTTYSAWATATWDWYGGTRSFARLEGPAEVSTGFSAEDSYGDRIYNTESAAYLETTSPPVVPPAAPTGVTAAQSNIEVGEKLELRFQVGWTPAPATAGLISSSTVTATPVGSSAPVLTATVSGAGTTAVVGPLAPLTTYRITVTNTDPEGTSAPSTPIEATSPNSDGEAPGAPPPTPPDFGRCVKVAGGGEFTTSSCQVESTTQTGSYEWVPGVEKAGFTTALKPATTVKLEAAGSKEKVTCTGESGSGQITGSKTVGVVTITLTGCESLGGKCTTSGLAEGEVQTATLEGGLGVERVTEVGGKETVHAALDLHPAGKSGSLLEFTCTTNGIWALGGAIIAPVVSGKTVKTTTFKLVASGGKQKPESFEGGVREVLVNALAEQVGVSLIATQTNAEAVEVNTVA